MHIFIYIYPSRYKKKCSRIIFGFEDCVDGSFNHYVSTNNSEFMYVCINLLNNVNSIIIYHRSWNVDK